MKKLILILLLCNSLFAQKQSFIHFSDKEYFTISTHIDPFASYKEKGLDIVGEIEYVGFIYAKMGFESFGALTGGYFDIHGAAGLNLNLGLFDQTRLYAGARMAKVDRNGAFRINYGLEAGIQQRLGEHYFIGLRTTLDKRYDQEIFRWKPENKLSGFITFGYRWDYKRR